MKSKAPAVLTALDFPQIKEGLRISSTRLTITLLILIAFSVGIAIAQGGGPPPSPAPDPWEAPDAPTGQYGAPVVAASNTGNGNETYTIDVDNGDTTCAYQIQELNDDNEWVDVGDLVEISQQSDTVTLGPDQRVQVKDYDSVSGTGKPSGTATRH